MTPCFFMELADEVPDLRTENSLHGTGLPSDHVHLDIARAKRCRHLEPDEARADHHGLLKKPELGDQGAAVGERAQIVHVRKIAAGHIEPHRLGAGREQQRIVRDGGRRPRAPPDRCAVSIATTRAPSCKSMFALVEVRRSKRNPLLGRAAREISLERFGRSHGSDSSALSMVRRPE